MKIILLDPVSPQANEYLDNSINNSSLVANMAAMNVETTSNLQHPLSHENNDTSLKYIPVLAAQKGSNPNLHAKN